MLIGDTKTFGIHYELHPYEDEDDKSLLCQSWGTIRIYVDGKNLSSYQKNGLSTIELEEYLYWILNWFTEKLIIILGHDPFPLPIESDCGINLINTARDVDIENDIEEIYREFSFEAIDNNKKELPFWAIRVNGKLSYRPDCDA